MKTKDFSILLEKVSTANSKKDLAFVSGTNSIVQQIENVLRTNKGENVSNMSFGANIKDYTYDVAVNRQIITSTLRSVIKSSIRKIFDVSVTVNYYSDTVIIFDIQFSTEISLTSQNKSSCQIEIPLS
jgi:phage baseplate assembly protein W